MPSTRATARRRHLLVAAVAGLVLTALLMWGFALAKSSTGSSGPAGAVAMTQVVAITSDLPAETTLTATDLKYTSVATAQVTADDVTKIESVVGQLTTVHLTSGAVLHHSDLSGLGSNQIAVKLPAGHVATSIPFAESPDFGGYAQPGDHIDIICSNGDGTTYYCFRHVLVIQVGGKSQQPTPAPPDGGILPVQSSAAPTPATVINGGVLLVVDMSYADALIVQGDLTQTKTAKSSVLAYTLESTNDAPAPTHAG